MFISGWHSRDAVDMMCEVGARHAIGIESTDSGPTKEAIHTFTKGFYERLWESESQVCVAFKCAKIDVSLKHGLP